jgi:lysophospholipase L1-like esterase
MLSRVTGIEDLQVRDSLGQHARPGAAFKQFHINSLGFRGPEVSDNDLRTNRLVVTTGSSETFGLYESSDREWPHQLSDSLARRCATERVTVLNAAIHGMSLPSARQDLHLRVLRLRPSVIVYYPQPTQYLYERVPRPVSPSADPQPELAGLRLRGTARLRGMIKAAVPEALLELIRRRDTDNSRKSGQSVFEKVPQERVDSMESQIRLLVGEVRHAGSEIMLVAPDHRFGDTAAISERRWLRAWERQVPKGDAHILLEFSRAARTMIRDVARDSSVTLVQPDFPQDAGRAQFFADPVHFTDKGAGVLAGAVSRQLADRFGCR